jgi:hypothetical protein
MRRFAPKPVFAALAVALILAQPLAAYTIHLKDGSTIIAKEKYRIENGKAIIVMPNGTKTFLDAREIDVRKTEEANRNNYGTAVVLENETRTEPGPPPPPRQQTVSDLITNRTAAPRELPGVRRETPGTAASRPGGVAKTKAGFVDFSTVARKPYANLDVASELQQFFRGQGLEEVEIYSGTQASRPLLEVTTNSEAAIFRALAVGSTALLHMRDRHPDRIEAFELLLTTAERARAGQFVLTPEMASELVSKRVDVAAFFVNYVQF